MEQETDISHLFTQHQFIVFVVGSLLILACLTGILVLFERRAERRSRKGESNESGK